MSAFNVDFNFGLWPIRNMDTRSKHTVYGFLRDCELLLEAHMYIPDEIFNVCLIFYYHVQDSFAQYGPDLATDIDSDLLKNYKTRIMNLGKKTPSKYNTAYGKTFVDPFENKVHRWILRIHRSNGDCFVGVDSSDRSSITGTFIANDVFHSGYSYKCYRNLQQYYAISSNGKKYSHYTNGKKCEVTYSSGDKLKLILDFSNDFGSLSISINGEEYKQVFRMIQKSKFNPEYRLAISLSIGSYVELINYCYSVNSDLDLYAD
eukprot:483547_1